MTTAPIDPEEHVPVITGVGKDPDYDCSIRFLVSGIGSQMPRAAGCG